MTVKTLRSFDLALREPKPGGEDGVWLVRRGGEDVQFFVVGVLGSELDADGGTALALILACASWPSHDQRLIELIVPSIEMPLPYIDKRPLTCLVSPVHTHRCQFEKKRPPVLIFNSAPPCAATPRPIEAEKQRVTSNDEAHTGGDPTRNMYVEPVNGRTEGLLQQTFLHAAATRECSHRVREWLTSGISHEESGTNTPYVPGPSVIHRIQRLLNSLVKHFSAKRSPTSSVSPLLPASAVRIIR